MLRSSSSWWPLRRLTTGILSGTSSPRRSETTMGRSLPGDGGSGFGEPGPEGARKRRQWVRQHPLIAIPLLVAFAAADLWLRLQGTGQHTPAGTFWFLVALVVIGALIVFSIRLHFGNRES